jgi:hypothetical protein
VHYAGVKKHAFPDNYMKKLLQCAPMCIFSGTHSWTIFKKFHQSEKRLDGSMTVAKLQLWPFLAAALLIFGHILVRVDLCT